MRIAVVGGESYVKADLERFLVALYEKHPHATIVTGSATRSCEPFIRQRAHVLGFKVETPEPNYIAFGDEAMACQVNDILIGADVIITVGSKGGGRAKIAETIWKRCHAWRENAIPLHNIAAEVKTKAAPKQKAKKPQAQLAA